MLKNVKFVRESNYSRKGLLANECLKQTLATKADQKMMSKILLGFNVLLNFLSSHIKSDDVPPEVKLDNANNTEMGKVNKIVKM